MRVLTVSLFPAIGLLGLVGCIEPPGPEGYVIEAAFTHSWNDIDPVSGTIDYKYDSENPDPDRNDLIECRRSLQPARYDFTLEGDEGSLGNDQASGWNIYISLRGDTEEMYSFSVFLYSGLGAGEPSVTRSFEAEETGDYIEPIEAAGCSITGTYPEREWTFSCDATPPEDNPEWALSLDMELTCATWL